MLSGSTILLILAALVVAFVVICLLRRRSAATANTTSTPAASSSPLRSAITDGSHAGSQPAPSANVSHDDPQPQTESEPEEAAAEEEEVEPTAAELIAHGDEQIRAFEYDNAIEFYESAQDPVTSEQGRDSLEFAQLLVKTEDAYFARDNQDDTDELNCNNYLRALSIMERRLGAFDVRLLPVLNRIVAFYLLTEKVSEAENLVRRAQLIESRERTRQSWIASRSAASSLVAPTSAVVPSSLPDAANTTIAAGTTAPGAVPAPAKETAAAPAGDGNGDHATELLLGALDSGNGDVDKLANAGDSARSEFDYDAAVDRYTEALEAAQTAFGRDSVKLVPVLTRLADAFHARDIMETDSDGDGYTDPLDQTRLALSLLVKDRGILDPRLVPVLTNMVAFSDLLGDHFKAGSYLNMLDNIVEADRRNALR